MRIVYFMPNLHITGGARVAVEIGRRLAERGHDFTIVIPKGRIRLPVEAAVKFREVGWRTSRPIVALGASFISFILKTPSSDVYLASMPPNAIAAHIAGRLRGSLSLNYVLNDDLHFFDDGSYLRNGFVRWLYRQAAKFSLRLGGIIANSHWTATRCVHAGAARPIGIVPSGYDERVFSTNKRAHCEREGPFRLIAVGRKPRWKGMSTLVDALNLIDRETHPFRLKLITQDELDLSKARFPFEIVAPKNDAELADSYRSGEIFLHTSWFEGFGLPPLEAQACGLAVVATNSGGVREFLRDGENALIVPPREPPTLARAVVRLMEDEALRRRLIERSLETCRAFTWDKVTDSMEKLLTELTANGRS